MTQDMNTGRRGCGGCLGRTLLGLLILVVVLLGAGFAVLVYLHIPSNASAMAAKSVCSAAFVAGREKSAEQLMAEDVLPANSVLKLVSTSMDTEQHTVSAKFLGMFERRASLLPNRGCVLDEAPDPQAVPYTPAPVDPRPWPTGDKAVPADKWPAGVKRAKLQKIVDEAFVGSGDPQAANARGVAVVLDGRLLVVRVGEGLQPNTALHGWSMTKTVAAMLAYKKSAEVGLDIETPVVDAFPAGREPEWVGQWRQDERRDITVADLYFMRDGLDINEGYGPTGDVVQMLYGEPNMASWAAEHKSAHPPGTFWMYQSATSNILAQVIEAQFATPQRYWTDPQESLFDPIGMRTATLETDTSGTWVGSSYLWASAGDWARLGQLMLEDGTWRGERVLPPGWLRLAGTPAMPDGPGHGYGAQTWRPADPVGGICKDYGLPRDTVEMEGHWGQLVSMVPSRRAVVVRLGWTMNKDQFDGCRFVSDVLSALPKR